MGHGVGRDKEIHFAHLLPGRWGCKAAGMEKHDSMLLVLKKSARCASVLRGLGWEIGRRVGPACWQIYLFSYFFCGCSHPVFVCIYTRIYTTQLYVPRFFAAAAETTSSPSTPRSARSKGIGRHEPGRPSNPSVPA